MRTIHQGPGAPSPDLQAEYTQAIRPRYLPLFENALAFGGSPYTQAIRPRYLPLFENALAFGGSPYTGLGVMSEVRRVRPARGRGCAATRSQCPVAAEPAAV